MEITLGQNSCLCEGREYAHFEKVCQTEAFFICKDGSGRWTPRFLSSNPGSARLSVPQGRPEYASGRPFFIPRKATLWMNMLLLRR